MTYPSNVMLKGKLSELRFSNLNQAHCCCFYKAFASKETLLSSDAKNAISFFSFVLQLEIKIDISSRTIKNTEPFCRA